MASVAEARKVLQKLLDKYDKHKDDKKFMGNERQVCRSLIEPLVHNMLNWDTEDPSEFKPELSDRGKRLDYAIYHEGIPQYIIEAKAPTKDIFDNVQMYTQTVGYARGKEKDFAILTNFRQIVILRCDVQVDNILKAGIEKIDLLQATDEDIEKILYFEKKYWLKSGKENELYTKLATFRKRIPVDMELLQDMTNWRELLLKSVKKNAKDIDFSNDEEFMHVEEEIQTIINRLIFICFCEDKELYESKLKGLIMDKRDRGWNKPGFLLEKIRRIFRKYNDVYDSDLFEMGNCDGYPIDDRDLMKVLEDLRMPKKHIPYDFRSIDIDIIGRAYEQFLGNFMTEKKQSKEKQDIGKRKKAGIYYTPKYIVDYIVNNTVRPYVKGKSFDEVLKVKILDPACGSGSFLLRAFDVLVDECGSRLKRELTYAEKKKLMLSCIFGVDLDERAVAITKLTLALKLAGKGKKLPMFEDNIRIGNSLIDDDKIAGYKAFDWEEEFEEIMDEGGFDVVIGNPPYIRIQTLEKNEVEFFSTNYKSATKNYDIYVLFVEKAISFLKKNGNLGFILPSKFMSADYGLGLRKIITERKLLKKIVDFKDFQIFEGATTYTCLLFLQKKKNKQFQFLEISDKKILKAKKNIAKDNIIISKQQHPTDPLNWKFYPEDIMEIMEKLHSIKTRLGSICDAIFQGIITGADKIYVVKKNPAGTFYSIQTKKNYAFEKPTIFPLLKGSKHIRRYHIEKSEKYVIFPYTIQNKKAIPLSEEEIKTKYPIIYDYLIENKKELEKRDKGKMKGSSWYLFSRNQNLNKFEGKKMITPSIAKKPSFTLDDRNSIFVGSGGGGGGAYGITLKENRLYPSILAILNSKLSEFFIANISSIFSGGFFAYNKQYIQQIPLPENLNNAYQELNEYSNRLLRLHDKLQALGPKLTTERKKIKKEIEKTDKRINDIVYKLYGITEKERKIIEEALEK